MAISAHQLMGELKALCRGRGVHAPAFEKTLGPLLAAACAVDDNDGAEVVREKFGAWVGNRVHVLPDDLRLVVTTALGLNPQAQHVFLAHRLDWLGVHSHRDARTVRRRLDDGLKRLAEAALRPHRPRREEWYVARIRIELHLDATPPTRLEQWTVVALRDGVDEFTLPCATDVTVVKGAVQGEFGLRFQKPLRAGETREFWVRAPMTAAASYALRCDRFDVVVTDSSTSDRSAPLRAGHRDRVTRTA